MRAVLKALLTAAVAALLIAVPAAGATTSQPTPSQIKAQIKRATSSRELWSTINSCNDKGDAEIGIRGQMPALSFPAHLLMVVTVAEWSPTAHRYEDVKGTWKLGGKVFDAGALVQEGISLKWSGQVTLIGHITFEWFRDGKLLGSTTRVTTAGHSRAAGQPSGYSVGSCSIG